MVKTESLNGNNCKYHTHNFLSSVLFLTIKKTRYSVHSCLVMLRCSIYRKVQSVYKPSKKTKSTYWRYYYKIHLPMHSVIDVAPSLNVVILSPHGRHIICHILSWYVPTEHSSHVVPTILWPVVQFPVATAKQLVSNLVYCIIPFTFQKLLCWNIFFIQVLYWFIYKKNLRHSIKNQVRNKYF